MVNEIGFYSLYSMRVREALRILDRIKEKQSTSVICLPKITVVVVFEAVIYLKLAVAFHFAFASLKIIFP